MTRRLKALVGIAALAVMFTGTPADARHHSNKHSISKVHKAKKAHAKHKRHARNHVRYHSRKTHRVVVAAQPAACDRHGALGIPCATQVVSYEGLTDRRYASAGSIVGGRPAGCPHAYCGCALSIEFFGHIRPHLNVAENWKGFTRSAPSSGMVAARRGHVFKLLSHVGGDVWMVLDPNSGGHRTRIHQRSIAGYTIHNPHGTYANYNGSPGRHYRRNHQRSYRVARR